MVAAYLVGFTIDRSNGVAVCETPTQTGCQVTWNTVGPQAGALFDAPDNICVNPMTWRTDGLRAGHEANLGRDNYHIYDYAFFYMNIRQNVQARVDAFMRTMD